MPVIRQRRSSAVMAAPSPISDTAHNSNTQHLSFLLSKFFKSNTDVVVAYLLGSLQPPVSGSDARPIPIVDNPQDPVANETHPIPPTVNENCTP